MDDLPVTNVKSLLNQIVAGDDKAIETLYRHYQRPLFAYVRHLISVDEVADDIVHDTFLVVQQKPLSFDGSCKFFTWLCAIAKNKARDWQRKNIRRQKLVVEELDETMVDESWDVLGCFESSELSEIMQGCIDNLSLVQREATYWVYYHDLRLDEVATLQGSPVNTIKTRLLHARQKVRDCLEKAYAQVGMGRG